MKILLINPWRDTNFPQPPLGLAMIAAVLEERGYQVKILDINALGLSGNSISHFILDETPDIIGLTAMTPNINSAIKLARKIKEVNKDILVVLGGAHPTLFPIETLKVVPEVDIVIHGEGEETMIELVETLDRGESVSSQILGIAYRSNGELHFSQKRPYISDLDDLPFPSFHLLPMKNYRLHPPHGKQSPTIPILTSRGCPYRCIYCSKAVFGNKYRANSSTYVVDEIEFLMESFNVKEIMFYDDVFTLNKKRVYEICDELDERGLDIPWTCETRVNLVNRKLLERMNKAGCYLIAYGVESGNQAILNNLKKDITIEQIVNAFELTHRVGIQTIAYFMLGCPGETPDTVKETIALSKKLDPDFAQFSIATPFPGTELFRIASKSGVVPKNWNDYVYAELRSFDFPAFQTSTLKKEDLKKWNIKAYRSFYFRFNYLYKRFRKIRSVNELKLNAQGLFMLTKLVRKNVS